MENCIIASYEDDSVTSGKDDIETEPLNTDRLL